MALDNGPDTFDAEIDALFGQHIAAEHSTGLIVGLTDARGLVRHKAFGTIDKDGTAPDVDTLFPIASISKQFVAAAALVAVERGSLRLDDPITDYVSEFSATGPECDPPTVGELLSMSGGLTEDNAWIDPFIDMPEDELLAQASTLQLSHLPGTTFDYSNVGYTLAGIAVGRAVGMPIEQWVHTALLTPLGLRSTCFDSEYAARSKESNLKRATGFHREPDGQWVAYPEVESAAFAAAGGMMSTVGDLARWITWLGAAFRPAGADQPSPAQPSPTQPDPDAVLSRRSRRRMQRLHSPAIPALATAPGGALQPVLGGYGLGLFIGHDLHRGLLVSHGGGLPGFGLYVLWHPDSGHGVVALSNSERGSVGGLSGQALGRILAKHQAPAQTIRLWPQTVELMHQVDQLIREWDDELAAEVFAANVAFDKPLARRRDEIAKAIADIGPLSAPGPRLNITSSSSSADVTWAINGERGELICMIHLTPVLPAQVQELAVQAVSATSPRSAAPADIARRRANLGPAYLSSASNVRVVSDTQTTATPAPSAMGCAATTVGGLA